MRELSAVLGNLTDCQCSTFPFMLFTTVASSSYTWVIPLHAVLEGHNMKGGMPHASKLFPTCTCTQTYTTQFLVIAHQKVDLQIHMYQIQSLYQMQSWYKKYWKAIINKYYQWV